MNFSRNKYRFPTHHCPSRIQRGGLEQAIAELIIEARNQGLDEWQSRQNVVDCYVEYTDREGNTFRDPIEWIGGDAPNVAIQQAAHALYERAYREKLIVNKIISNIYT